MPHSSAFLSGLVVVLLPALLLLTAATASPSDHQVHLITASVLGQGDIKDLRDANFLLKSRHVYGGPEFSSVQCSWVIFLPPFKIPIEESVSLSRQKHSEEGFVTASIKQARHIAAEANCTPLFVYETQFKTADEMVWLAVKRTFNYLKSENLLNLETDATKSTQILFMLSQAVILSNPMSYFNRVLIQKKLDSESADTIFMHLPNNHSFVGCGLNIFLLPAKLVEDALSFDDSSKVFKKPVSMCSVIEHAVRGGDSSMHAGQKQKQYVLMSVPLYFRYPLELDSVNGLKGDEKYEFQREASFQPSHRRQVPSVLLTVAGHNVDWYLFNSSLSTRTDIQNLYTLSDISLDCELQLSLPSFNNPTHLKMLPIGAIYDTTDHETQPESLVNYTQLKDVLYPSAALCKSMFGSLLPDAHKWSRINGRWPQTAVELNSFNAVPEWVISPSDYDSFTPGYNSNEYLWDGSSLSKHDYRAYATFLKTTEPTLFYRNPLTKRSPSVCSIQILAYGDRHLHFAYENAIRIHKYSAYSSRYGDSSETDTRWAPLTEDLLCLNKPLVYLYTFDSATVLNAAAQTQPNSFLQKAGNITIDIFLAAFDGIFDLCNSKACQSYFPSNDAVFAALQSSAQRLSYHTTPSLWWQVSNMLQHPPSRFVMYLDAGKNEKFYFYFFGFICFVCPIYSTTVLNIICMYSI